MNKPNKNFKIKTAIAVLISACSVISYNESLASTANTIISSNASQAPSSQYSYFEITNNNLDQNTSQIKIIIKNNYNQPLSNIKNIGISGISKSIKLPSHFGGNQNTYTAIIPANKSSLSSLKIEANGITIPLKKHQ